MEKQIVITVKGSVDSSYTIEEVEAAVRCTIKRHGWDVLNSELHNPENTENCQEKIMYIPCIGRMYPTDSTVCLNDKEYLIEGVAWDIVSSYLPDRCKVHGRQIEEPDVQKLLEFVYHNYDHEVHLG